MNQNSKLIFFNESAHIVGAHTIPSQKPNCAKYVAFLKND
jgi:hypothetical protein